MSNNSGRVESSRNAPSASCMAIPKIEACWDMYIVLFVSVSLSNLLRRYHHTHKSQSHFTEFNVTFFLETFFFFFFLLFLSHFPSLLLQSTSNDDVFLFCRFLSDAFNVVGHVASSVGQTCAYLSAVQRTID
jgi:cytochrome bd-type quinol oxidase subunit 2